MPPSTLAAGGSLYPPAEFDLSGGAALSPALPWACGSLGSNHALPGLFITSPALSEAGFGPYIAQPVLACLILKLPRLGNNIPLAASLHVEA